jgi:hypothetical protein
MCDEPTANNQPDARPRRESTIVATSDRSQSDLMRWAACLMERWGFRYAYGFDMIGWSHDQWCALHPNHGPALLSSRCTCEPDATIVLHIGTANERRIPVVRDGVELPVRFL